MAINYDKWKQDTIDELAAFVSDELDGYTGEELTEFQFLNVLKKALADNRSEIGDMLRTAYDESEGI